MSSGGGIQVLTLMVMSMMMMMMMMRMIHIYIYNNNDDDDGDNNNDDSCFFVPVCVSQRRGFDVSCVCICQTASRGSCCRQLSSEEHLYLQQVVQVVGVCVCVRVRVGGLLN